MGVNPVELAEGRHAADRHDQQLVVQTIREFVERDVMPVASEMEHRGEYPHALVETMKELGLFGLNIPEEYGGTPVDYTTFAIVFEELSRGWMALAGIIGSHLVLADVLVRYGTEEQKRRFLPRLAKGEPRGGICLSEPNAGHRSAVDQHRRHAATATSTA